MRKIKEEISILDKNHYIISKNIYNCFNSPIVKEDEIKNERSSIRAKLWLNPEENLKLKIIIKSLSHNLRFFNFNNLNVIMLN